MQVYNYLPEGALSQLIECSEWLPFLRRTYCQAGTSVSLFYWLQCTQWKLCWPAMGVRSSRCVWQTLSHLQSTVGINWTQTQTFLRLPVEGTTVYVSSVQCSSEIVWRWTPCTTQQPMDLQSSLPAQLRKDQVTVFPVDKRKNMWPYFGKMTLLRKSTFSVVCVVSCFVLSLLIFLCCKSVVHLGHTLRRMTVIFIDVHVILSKRLILYWLSLVSVIVLS